MRHGAVTDYRGGDHCWSGMLCVGCFSTAPTVGIASAWYGWWMVNNRKRSIGDTIQFLHNFNQILTGRVTCFYPLQGSVDVRTNRGHTYKVRSW